MCTRGMKCARAFTVDHTGGVNVKHRSTSFVIFLFPQITAMIVSMYLYCHLDNRISWEAFGGNMAWPAPAPAASLFQDDD